MAHQTEAACLIQSGAAYGRRVGLRSATGRTVFAGFKPGGFSLFDDDAPFFHFDLEGRWQRALIEGVHYLKSLDCRVIAIDRVREQANLVLHRRTLSFAEANDLDALIRGTALELIEGLLGQQWEAVAPPDPAHALSVTDLLEFLDQIGRWDAAAWFRHRERYLSTYGPLPFLPPEVQQAVVLQATLGHPDGVAFGGAAPAEAYVRSPEEFETHATDVAGLLGRRMAQCRVVFLAGADVLRQPQQDVIAYLETATRRFAVEPNAPKSRMKDWTEAGHRLDGVLAMLDDFRLPLPDRDAWVRYRAGNLARVVLGVESGSAEIRAVYGKSWSDDALVELVTGLKGAGIPVSVLILGGAGGREHREDHLVATRNLLGRLGLGAGDFVYLLDDDEVGHEAVWETLRRIGLTPLDPHELDGQRARLKSDLSEILTSERTKVLTYSLEKQWT